MTGLCFRNTPLKHYQSYQTPRLLLLDFYGAAGTASSQLRAIRARVQQSTYGASKNTSHAQRPTPHLSLTLPR